MYGEEAQVRGLELEKFELLKGLLIRMRGDDITNIDEAIEMGRTTLASFIPRNPVAASSFEVFAESLFLAFERTKNFEYLNESISIRRQILQ
jgi:hypothetical protein